jgi:hypothetical protein
MPGFGPGQRLPPHGSRRLCDGPQVTINSTMPKVMVQLFWIDC